MRLFLLTISLLLTFQTVSAQSNLISINATGTAELPADIIYFNITVNARGDSPQSAYRLHKEREKVLVQLLDKHRIKEENIYFEPVAISRDRNSNRYPREKEGFQTSQSVSLKLKDFDAYEKIQVALIEEGFDRFRGNFSSTKLKEGKDRALKEAVAAARERAELIAAENGLKLGTIHQINYQSRNIRPVQPGDQHMMSMPSSNENLLKFEQQITISASITIEFNFHNSATH